MTTTVPAPCIVDRLAIIETAWHPFRDRRGRTQLGVHQKVIWDEQGTGYAGLLRLDPGAEIEPHAHRFSVHHMWIVSGGCVIGEDYVQTGSYVYVPAGLDHGIGRAGPDGCTIFYLYLRA